ncbi:MAG: hypothetical protein NC114_11825 [Ruminococcus flavefaciens]|nr:hypothetical protein [Ruminococcus flavefaciens]
MISVFLGFGISVFFCRLCRFGFGVGQRFQIQSGELIYGRVLGICRFVSIPAPAMAVSVPIKVNSDPIFIGVVFYGSMSVQI